MHSAVAVGVALPPRNPETAWGRRVVALDPFGLSSHPELPLCRPSCLGRSPEGVGRLGQVI